MTRTTKPAVQTRGGQPWQQPDVVQGVADAVRNDLARLGKLATIKAVRFVPSTVVKQPNGDIQMIANTTVEVCEVIAPRPEVIESVITIGSSADHALKNVTTHALSRTEYA